MKCQDATTALSAELDRELGRGERRDLFEHLDACALCRARRVRMADVDRALRAGRERAIAAPMRLRGRIEAMAATQTPRRWGGWAAAVALAAAAGAAIMFFALQPPAVGVVVASLQGDEERTIFVGAGAGARPRAPGEALRAGDVVRASGGGGVVRVGERTRARLEDGAAVVLGGADEAMVVARGLVTFEVGRGRDAVRVQATEGTTVTANGARFTVAPREVRVEAGRAQVAARGTVVVAAAGDVVAVAVGERPRKVTSGALVRVSPDGREPRAKPPVTGLPAHIERQAQGHAAAGGAAGASRPASAAAAAPMSPAGVARPAETSPDSSFVVRGVVEVEGGGSHVEDMPPGDCSDPRAAALWVKDGRVANAAVVVVPASDPRPSLPAPPERITLSACGLWPRTLAWSSALRVELENATPGAILVALRGPTWMGPWSLAAQATAPLPSVPEGTYEVIVGDPGDPKAPRSWVYVSDGPTATTDRAGHFTLRNVRAGARTVRVVHPMLGGRTVEVEVGPNTPALRVVLPARPATAAPPPAAAASPAVAAATPPAAAAPELPPPAAVALEPSLRRGANDCQIAIRNDNDVVKACRAGGIKRAKTIMKAMAKTAKENGMKTDCDSCHQNEEDWRLTKNAEADFARMLDVIARGRKR